MVTQNLAAVLNRPVDIDIQEINNPRVSSIVALYLLSLVFLVITHAPLVHALAWVILNGDHSVFKEGAAEILNAYIEHRLTVVPGFGEPRESLEQALETFGANSTSHSYDTDNLNTLEPPDVTSSGIEVAIANTAESTSNAITTNQECTESNTSKFSVETASAAAQAVLNNAKLANITDEEKEKIQKLVQPKRAFNELNRPFLEMVLSALDCTENDYVALLSSCLIYAMAYNRGEFVRNLERIN